jgi:cell division protein FtsZ
MSIEMIEVEAFNLGTQIKVIGVGGGGGNAVDHMISRCVQGVEFICANTDAQSLSRSTAHRRDRSGRWQQARKGPRRCRIGRRRNPFSH